MSEIRGNVADVDSDAVSEIGDEVGDSVEKSTSGG